MIPDYYSILGIEPTSTKEEIKKAYRRLALRYHPDKNKEPDAHDRFIEINEAYLVLNDDDARAKYDAERATIRPDEPVWERTSGESSTRSFADEELRRWARNARSQAQGFASMNYKAFSDLVGQVLTETGSQAGTAIVYALSSSFGVSAIASVIYGVVQGSIGHILLGLLIGALCWYGLSFALAKYS